MLKVEPFHSEVSEINSSTLNCRRIHCVKMVVYGEFYKKSNIQIENKMQNMQANKKQNVSANSVILDEDGS